MKRLEPTWIVTVSRLVHYTFLVTAQNGDPVLAYASLSLAIEKLRTTLLKILHSKRADTKIPLVHGLLVMFATGCFE